MQLFNTTVVGLMTEYLPSDWKNTIIVGCLAAYMPIFVYYFAGKMIFEGFNHFKNFFEAVVAFQPFFNSNLVKFIECFRLIIGTFWLMFAVLVISPLYPFYLAAYGFFATVWDLGTRAYYWKWPKTVYTVEEPKSFRSKSIPTNPLPTNSYESVEMTYNGPVVPTLNVN